MIKHIISLAVVGVIFCFFALSTTGCVSPTSSVDTLVVKDTLVKVNKDTIFKTTHKIDTLYRIDTIRIDTTVVFDTVFLGLDTSFYNHNVKVIQPDTNVFYHVTADSGIVCTKLDFIKYDQYLNLVAVVFNNTDKVLALQNMTVSIYDKETDEWLSTVTVPLMNPHNMNGEVLAKRTVPVGASGYVNVQMDHAKSQVSSFQTNNAYKPYINESGIYYAFGLGDKIADKSAVKYVLSYEEQ